MTRKLAVLVCILVGVPSGDAAAQPSRACSSAGLHYAFLPGAPKIFGVHKLRVSGAGCITARRVAKAWMAKYEAGVDAGRSSPPRTAAGFVFTTLRPDAAQTYRERGRRGSATVRFDYLVPNS